MNIQTLAQTLRIAPPVGAANLTMYPLLADVEKPAGYLTLDESLAAGFVKVTEVSEAGHVPELTIVNDGPTPVLVLDGEELVGAKQNRIVNLTILVPARRTLRLPVSCVEAGRWSRRSHAFAAAGRTHYASGRAMKVEQVSSCLRTSGGRHADQSAIWADIDAKSARMAATSPTHAAAEMYRRARGALDDFQAGLEPLPCQVGAIFAINGVIAGLELFDSPATWRKSMRKIVESYGLDAVDRQEEAPRRAPDDPGRFLSSVSTAEVESFPAIGLGTDLRFKSGGTTGAALAVDDELVHLLAFAS
ncbi:MAG: ARPP-1 family domain-containing protein [Vicinamibacterales bacterium]